MIMIMFVMGRCIDLMRGLEELLIVCKFPNTLVLYCLGCCSLLTSVVCCFLPAVPSLLSLPLCIRRFSGCLLIVGRCTSRMAGC